MSDSGHYDGTQHYKNSLVHFNTLIKEYPSILLKDYNGLQCTIAVTRGLS